MQYLPASACFAKYVKKHKGAVSVEELRSLLIGTLGALFEDDVFNSELGFDKFILEWKERWGKGFESEGERGQHLQALYRYGLASEEYGRGYVVLLFL